MNDARLAACCRLFDIEPGYEDVWGKSHVTPPETMRALLGAMGVDLGRGIEQAAAEREAAPWRRRLPPVQVVRRGESAEVLLRLPRADANRTVRCVYTLESGERRTVDVRPEALGLRGQIELEGRALGAYALPLPELPLGYHRLELEGFPETLALVVAPEACYVPEALSGERRVWGATLQLYALRSPRNWGIGDFTDLRTAIERLAEQGAGIVGVNPLHALYPHNPAHASPYSPSSRLFFNVLYIDIEGIADFAQCAAAQQMVYAREFQRRLEQLRAEERVDYIGVAALKLPVLELLFQYFREHHLERNTARAQIFREYQAREGKRLYHQALYDALQEHFHREDKNVWGWPAWPAEFRRPDSPAVAQWAAEHRDRIDFYQYLQWQADRQLGMAGRRSYELGLGVGIYQDLAVSVDRGGADAWVWQDLYALGASIGAPPDEFSPNGQDWGLPPLIPARLREAAYAPFIATLRANMRHSGALRIDHVMAFRRLYWIPQGATPKEGAYVRYPFEDLLGIVALESQRNRCLVVGEDLGTVPDEVREALAPRRVLSYRVLYFERNGSGDFRPPSAYPEGAVAAVTTHDLPTLAGYWKGQDLLERERLKLIPSDEQREQLVLARAQDRVRLLMALEREQLLPEGVTVDPASCPDMTPELARAVHVYLARSPAKIVALQLEDVLGELCQQNLPGTVDQYPNWRRKLTLELEQIWKDPRAQRLFAAMRETRGLGLVTPPPLRPGGDTPIPGATYRLQLHRDFTFRDAAALVPYLARLGVTHVYCSPYLKARPGSRHGYDIVDHNALNPEIGSEADYAAFIDALHAHGLGQILDIVPNHMGVGSDNQWWLDVLENGQASQYAAFFDIDWRPLKAELRGKVLLPVLGDHYGRVLERGELKLAWDAASGAFSVHYYDHRFPIDPVTYPLVLERDLRALEEALGAGHPRLVEFESLISAFRNLPGRGEREPDRVIERARDKEVHKKRLVELCAAEPRLREHIERVVARYNEPPWDALHELLENQAYRVAYWRTASDEINYRRFFDINDLAALRMEAPQAFYTTHRLISELIAQGKVNGLRVDHPDGLYDPPAYYERLQSFVTAAAATGGRSSPRPEGLYVVVEKILASHEHLPAGWPVHGTTGYDFANLVNGLFVDEAAEEELTRIYARFIGRTIDFDALLADRKRMIMRTALSSELNVLANHLNRLSEADWYARDFTLNALRHALREVVAFFPVYRTYVRNESVSPEDRRYIEWAVAQARKHSLAADVSVFDFVRRILLLEDIERLPEAYRRAALDFTMRFQQYTAPVMAKGLEDTAFYIYNRFVSLNEVGGDPRRFGVSVAGFHRGNQDRQRRFPYSMLATSTHDTKRSEDVRARINVISEIPGEWRAAVARWARINRSKRRRLESGYAPDRNDEYLLYQTLVGAWPLEELDAAGLEAFRERIEAYLLKAVREAKVYTSWINPNVEYEEAVQEFVRALLGSGHNLFLQDFVPFVRRLTVAGLCNGLAQTLLKLTAPGVPDIYQGNEIWDFSLVDPDNRRPVDYGRRERLLRELEAELEVPTPERTRALLDRIEDGRAKLYVTWRALRLRRARAELFRDGEYLPLATQGSCAGHVCAFARRDADGLVVTAVPRLTFRLAGGSCPLGAVWADTRIEVPAAGGYANVLTGEALRAQSDGERSWLEASAVFAAFPVALLEHRG
ncbi:MAG TPA: malto-oligosyltrehalose synthase [Burkholderiales bacterium]